MTYVACAVNSTAVRHDILRMWGHGFANPFLQKTEYFYVQLNILSQSLRPDFTSKLVHVLAFGIPEFYIAPYDKIKHELVKLSSNCDVKSGLRLQNTEN